MTKNFFPKFLILLAFFAIVIGLIIEASQKHYLKCPNGMAFINSLGGFCVDKYEASRSDANSTFAGISDIPKSAPNVVVWTNINQSAAKFACAIVGKHLCTNDEWQAATETSPSNTRCPHGNTNYGKSDENYSEVCTQDLSYTPEKSDRCLAGSGPVTWCTTSGVCDLNGNVYEWVNAILFTSEPRNASTVICWNTSSEADVDKKNNICLKGWDMRGGNSGSFVANWNWTYNFPIKSADDTKPNASMGNDFFYTWCGGNATGYDCSDTPGRPYGGWGANATTIYQRGVLRGGYWAHDEGSGCFNMYLSAAPSGIGAGVGFRCCL
jgi:formylglycine-generating enzyme required for sulfatase activity